jgi:hypothetical protein
MPGNAPEIDQSWSCESHWNAPVDGCLAAGNKRAESTGRTASPFLGSALQSAIAAGTTSLEVALASCGLRLICVHRAVLGPPAGQLRPIVVNAQLSRATANRRAQRTPAFSAALPRYRGTNSPPQCRTRTRAVDRDRCCRRSRVKWLGSRFGGRAVQSRCEKWRVCCTSHVPLHRSATSMARGAGTTRNVVSLIEGASLPRAPAVLCSSVDLRCFVFDAKTSRQDGAKGQPIWSYCAALRLASLI